VTHARADVEIPAAGRPTPFYNAAGKGLKIEATATPVELTPDASVLFTLRITRLLNAADVQRLNLAELEPFQRDFQIEDVVATEADPSGTRVFHYRLRPRRANLTTIPGLVFPYYDPNVPQPADRPDLPFRKARTEPITIHIAPATQPATPAAPLEVPAFAETLAGPSSAIPAWLSCLGVLAPPVLTLAACLLWWVRNPAGSRLVRHRRSHAARLAIKRLRGLDRSAESAPQAAVDCVCRYLAEHYDLPRVARTADELSGLLRMAGAGENTVGESNEFLRSADEARFAPNPAVSVELLVAQGERLVLHQEGEA
jgi:hypothetical protein